MITTPTISQIRDQIIADIEGKIGQTIPAMPKAFFRVLATALAGVVSLLYRFAGWAYAQIFPQTADAEALVRIGEQYGIVRLPAVAAELTATATGTNTTNIPAGTLWQKDGVVYQQTAAATVSGGSATITVEALTAGDAGNLDNGAVLAIATPLAGLDGTATVASTVTTGVDAESLTAYRTRVLTRLQQRPQGGAAADYIGWALEVPGIAKAFAFNTAAGEVTVYPLIALSGTRIPAGPKLTEVEDYLNDTVRRPLCANVLAAAMTERTFTLTVTTLQPNTTPIKNAITAALADYLLGRFPQQYADEANPTNMVVRSLIAAEAIAAGATIFEATLYIDGSGSPITYHQLADDELAKLGTITWP
jgi:uncharacterized phage protein gp47/JayE